MCEYTHDEWVNGFVKLNVDSIDKLKAKLPELRAELRDPGKWREIYNYAYSFSREVRYRWRHVHVPYALVLSARHWFAAACLFINLGKSKGWKLG
jgi:hypothetical protein